VGPKPFWFRSARMALENLDKIVFVLLHESPGLGTEEMQMACLLDSIRVVK